MFHPNVPYVTISAKTKALCEKITDDIDHQNELYTQIYEIVTHLCELSAFESADQMLFNWVRNYQVKQRNQRAPKRTKPREAAAPIEAQADSAPAAERSREVPGA